MDFGEPRDTDSNVAADQEEATYSKAPLLGLQPGHLDLLLLICATLSAIIFFKTSDAAGNAAGAAPAFTQRQTMLVAGYGLSLAGLIAHHLFQGDSFGARPRAMLALGLVWLPTVGLSFLALPFLGMAYAMWRGIRPWHAPGS